MEKYFNEIRKKDFTDPSTTTADILRLQYVLNTFGYKGKKGGAIEQDGKFDDDAQFALNQLKKDFKAYKEIKKSYQILNANQLIELTNSNGADMQKYASLNIDPEFWPSIDYFSTLMNDDKSAYDTKPLNELYSLITANSSKIFFIKKYDDKLNKYPYVPEIHVFSPGGNYIGRPFESDVLDKNSIIYTPTPEAYIVDAGDAGFNYSVTFNKIGISDDPKIFKMLKFDKVKIPPLKKFEKKEEVVEVKTPEKTKDKVPITLVDIYDDKKPTEVQPTQETRPAEIITDKKIPKIKIPEENPEKAPKNESDIREAMQGMQMMNDNLNYILQGRPLDGEAQATFNKNLRLFNQFTKELRSADERTFNEVSSKLKKIMGNGLSEPEPTNDRIGDLTPTSSPVVQYRAGLTTQLS